MGTELLRTFGSVGVAMVTPFRADGSLDSPRAAALARRLVDGGADTIVLSGTTGESPTTHQPEKNELVAAVVDEIGTDAMVVAGAGSPDTAHALRMVTGAVDSGAQGILAVTPYYNRPSQDGIYAHFMKIADASDLPVMLYDIPGRTGVKIEAETYDKLATHPNIRAVKDAVGSVSAGMATAGRTGLEYYSGDDELNFSWLAAGAAGVVSVVGHVAVSSYRQMVDAIDRYDLGAARQIDEDLRPLVRAIMGGGQGAVMAKEALTLMGVLNAPTVRLPLVPAREPDRDALKVALAPYL